MMTHSLLRAMHSPVAICCYHQPAQSFLANFSSADSGDQSRHTLMLGHGCHTVMTIISAARFSDPVSLHAMFDHYKYECHC
eukprot:scaffold10139_cov80-Attheya_sp.AAC.8